MKRTYLAYISGLARSISATGTRPYCAANSCKQVAWWGMVTLAGKAMGGVEECLTALRLQLLPA